MNFGTLEVDSVEHALWLGTFCGGAFVAIVWLAVDAYRTTRKVIQLRSQLTPEDSAEAAKPQSAFRTGSSHRCYIYTKKVIRGAQNATTTRAMTPEEIKEFDKAMSELDRSMSDLFGQPFEAVEKAIDSVSRVMDNLDKGESDGQSEQK